MNRREAIRNTLLVLSAGMAGQATASYAPKLHLGACDWSLRNAMNPAAFDVAKTIGLGGVQVSYNTKNDEAGLSNPATLQAIREASARTGIAVSSLGMARLNQVPYKSEPRAEEWVWNSVDAAKALGVEVVLLAFFSDGDLRNDPAGKKVVIERLKKVAPQAEKQGIILGIESYLSAQEHLEIIEAVGSKAVRVYYDARNSADAGHDIYKEIPFLGKDLICELHMKENDVLLGEGTIDWPRVARMLKEIDYRGWMQIESAMPQKADLVNSYRHNRQFLENLFDFS